MSDIIESEDSDYRYRAVAKREAVMAALATLVATLMGWIEKVGKFF